MGASIARRARDIALQANPGGIQIDSRAGLVARSVEQDSA